MNPNSLFNQTASIRNKSSFDSYGRPVVGAATVVSARVQLQNKTRYLGNGESIVILAVAYVPGDTEVSVKDTFSYSGVDYTVLSRSEQIDGQGNVNHIKIELI